LSLSAERKRWDNDHLQTRGYFSQIQKVEWGEIVKITYYTGDTTVSGQTGGRGGGTTSFLGVLSTVRGRSLKKVRRLFIKGKPI